MRRGLVQTVSLTESGRDFALRVVWPASKTKPIQIALEAEQPTKPRGRDPVSQVPVPPKEESARPEEADWYEATLVNDAPLEARPPECTVDILREWLRVSCLHAKETYPRIHSPSGLGERKEDYFVHELNQQAELIVRIRPGADMSANIQWYEVQDARFRAQWPSGAEKPTISPELVR
jgi:hypothetical protein